MDLFSKFKGWSELYLNEFFKVLQYLFGFYSSFFLKKAIYYASEDKHGVHDTYTNKTFMVSLSSLFDPIVAILGTRNESILLICFLKQVKFLKKVTL